MATAPFTVADLAGLLDDAAVFPPGNAPLPDAVRAHLALRGTPHGRLVGSLVLTPAHVASLGAILDEALGENADGTALPDGGPVVGPVAGPVAVSVVVRDLATLPDAVAAVRADPRLALAAVEVAAAGTGAVRAALAATADLPPHVDVWVEPGWGPDLAAAVDLVREAGRGLKLRTGGTVADAFPGEAALAAAVALAAGRGVRFKATAGLHHAVRHTDRATGFEHHGFGNLLLAASVAGSAGESGAREWLARRDPQAVAAGLASLGPARLAAVRRDRFASFGTCDVHDPRRDLEALGLLAREASGDRVTT
jgi:hypothetical protein